MSPTGKRQIINKRRKSQHLRHLNCFSSPYPLKYKKNQQVLLFYLFERQSSEERQRELARHRESVRFFHSVNHSPNGCKNTGAGLGET